MTAMNTSEASDRMEAPSAMRDVRGGGPTSGRSAVDVTKVVLGAITGAALGGLLVVVLLVAAIFVAVENERATEIASVVAVDYLAGDRGGFELDVSTGPGVVVLLAVGAAVGSAVAFRAARRREEETAP